MRDREAVVTGVNAGLAPDELAALRNSLNEQRGFRLDQLAQLGHVAPGRTQRARERARPPSSRCTSSCAPPPAWSSPTSRPPWPAWTRAATGCATAAVTPWTCPGSASCPRRATAPPAIAPGR